MNTSRKPGRYYRHQCGSRSVCSCGTEAVPREFGCVPSLLGTRRAGLEREGFRLSRPSRPGDVLEGAGALVRQVCTFEKSSVRDSLDREVS